MSSIVESSGGGGGLDWTSLTSGEQLFISLLTLPRYLYSYASSAGDEQHIQVVTYFGNVDPPTDDPHYDFSKIKKFTFKIRGKGSSSSGISAIYSVQIYLQSSSSNTVLFRQGSYTDSSSWFRLNTTWTEFGPYSSTNFPANLTDGFLQINLDNRKVRVEQFIVTSFTTTDNKVHTLDNLNY